MNFKSIEPNNPEVMALRNIIESGLVDESKRELAEGHLNRKLAEIDANRASAFDIDNLLSEADDVAVIHDLYITEGGETAHIDHVIINQCVDVYLVDSSLALTQLYVDQDGDWSIAGESAINVPTLSPVSDLRSKAIMLGRIIGHNRHFLPEHLNEAVVPNISYFVLNSNEATTKTSNKEEFLIEPGDIPSHIKPRGIVNRVRRHINKEQLYEFANHLVKLNSPDGDQWYQRFDISKESAVSNR